MYMKGSVFYYTTDLNGVTVLNPTVNQMRTVIHSLDDTHHNYIEVWLSHYESGWTMSVFPGGLIRFENEILKQPIRQLRYIYFTKILELWLRLSRGEVDFILNMRWNIVS